ncbi:MAG: TAXI family TRAP transporter solute-binding subunit [Rhodospirillales bacterium]|nr:TAXI family TRAP transporter solute-binding subunit [Rhodospirillales bacterium]
MSTQRAHPGFGVILLLIFSVVLLAACEGGPGESKVKEDFESSLAQAFPQGSVRLDSFRRAGSGPLSDSEQGERRIVYYNATLAVERDVDLSSWKGMNLGALAGLFGANEKGISGLKQGGNKAGDVLHVHGTVTYVNENGAWRPVRTVQVPVAAPPPEDNTGPPAEALRIVDSIRSLFERIGTAPERRAIITEELEKAYFQIRLRLDRSEGALVILGGPEAGEYYQVAGLIAAALDKANMPSRAIATDGSVENLNLVDDGQGDVALVENNLASRAYASQPPFTADAAVPDVRALASLFPEQLHVIVRPGANVANLADLRGKRVDIGQPSSGTRVDAEALLVAAGLSRADLAEASERGLAEGLEALKRNELDAVISTISAPARSIQAFAAANGISFLSLSDTEQARMAEADSGYVPVTIPAGTYAGQEQPVPTVAAVALLVARASLPDAKAEAVLHQVFGGIDFFAAGRAAGSQISRSSAKTGVGIPWHPAAERFFASPQSP